MTQVPEVSSEAVVPDTEQTEGGVEAKVTVRPELAEADKPTIVPAYCVPVMGVKVMDCVALVTVSLKTADVLVR